MDFEFSSQHEQVRETVARFAAEEIAPLVAEAEETEVLPRELFRKWAALGLLGVRNPEADGGSGFDKISDCIVREELSRVCQAFASSWSAHTHPLTRAMRTSRYYVAMSASDPTADIPDMQHSSCLADQS
ncbi:acyl-CoA dehydrogenase family protein [Bradyrhizobium sediminis]|uniref:Acyl-CoA dehydrogenase family protein n=1 Tax=Bradyrhizobium sediminis TaxID=2840469 RepID=A0A975NFE2_9BRAD|nr:acyl-CoA dehydrogenase family protein [Bradyrhizobium sediminis]QWG14132.1 acyl-CoA dehydrogenase family protein [Bradyrhizobium sediminis]